MQDRLRIVPCSRERANEFVARLHRHHKPTTGGILCCAVVDESGRVRPSRPRVDKTAIVRRGRWGLTLNPDVAPIWPVQETPQQSLALA